TASAGSTALTTCSVPSPNFQISSLRKPGVEAGPEASSEPEASKVTVLPASTSAPSSTPFVLNFAVGAGQPDPPRPKLRTLPPYAGAVWMASFIGPGSRTTTRSLAPSPVTERVEFGELIRQLVVPPPNTCAVAPSFRLKPWIR